MDYFTKSLDMGHSVDMIYLHFQKAFDTVPHKHLLCKLTSFEIQGQLLKWIESFLTNRQQVVPNGHLSLLVVSVLQGSILGPLLFIMFINDFNNHQ